MYALGGRDNKYFDFFMTNSTLLWNISTTRMAAGGVEIRYEYYVFRKNSKDNIFIMEMGDNYK